MPDDLAKAVSNLVGSLATLPTNAGDTDPGRRALAVRIALMDEEPTAEEVTAINVRLLKSCRFYPSPSEVLAALRKLRDDRHPGYVSEEVPTDAPPWVAKTYRMVRADSPEAAEIITRRRARALPPTDASGLADARRRFRQSAKRLGIEE